MALGEIDFVADAVLADFDLGGRGGVGLVEHRGLDAFEGAEVVVDVDAGKFGAREFVDERQPAEEALGDAERVDFAEQGVAVAVDHEAAEAVAVGADEAVGIGGLVELEEIAAQGDGAAQGGFEIRLVDRRGRMTDDAERNLGAGIEETAAGQVAVFVVDVDEIARAGVGGDLAKEARKDRRLERKVFELGPRLGPRGAVDGCARRGRFGQV